MNLIWLVLISLWGCGTENSGTQTEGNDSVVVADTPAGAAHKSAGIEPQPVRTGAERIVGNEFSRIKGQKIAIVANQTSVLLDGVHLVDSLHAMGAEIVRVFAPEHGFRGDHDAGAKVSSEVDEKTGIAISSLYGRTKKPTPEMLKGVDIVLFDIQDVGARFYTYISTMTYVMEACAENNVRMLVLDRPNPNGWYVDGPLLEKGLESFVGMHNIPIVHGMTVGEYAMMVNGEGWLKGSKKCLLDVLTVEGYDHSMQWSSNRLPWVAPSPNLATEYAAYLYPMLCWYEGMPVSVGRGTEDAFTIIGAPWHEGYHRQYQIDSIESDKGNKGVVLYKLEMDYYWFTPKSIPGKSTHPKFENELCYGVKFVNRVDGKNLFLAGLSMLLNMQEEATNAGIEDQLFQPFFKQIAGSSQLADQIRKGMSPEEIHESWEKGITDFKTVRKKYLLYTDFED